MLCGAGTAQYQLIMEESAEAWSGQDFQASVLGYLNGLSHLFCGSRRPGKGHVSQGAPEGLTRPPHACRNLLGCLPLGFDFNLGGQDLFYHELLCDCGLSFFHFLGFNFLIYNIRVLGSRSRVRPRPGSQPREEHSWSSIPT